MAARHRQPDYHTDWFRVLADLQYAGLANREVARKIRTPYATLRSWKGGREPAYEHGSRLLRLWCEVIGKPLHEVPITWG